jgi:nucleotide-binding universal stress UspA family protein
VGALEYAGALAARFGASMELFHVVEDPAAAGVWAAEGAVLDIGEIRAALVDEAERRLAECHKAAESLNVPVLRTVRIGAPASGIVEYARAADVDLIVMGTHGRSGFGRMLLGSVAERVVRHAPCAVVTVRGTETAGKALAGDSHATKIGAALGHAG